MKSAIKRLAVQRDGKGHTPGPWKVIPSPHGDKYACVQYGKNDMYTSLEMLPADAQLVAAAPELLAALESLVPHCDDVAMIGETDFERAWLAARAAIAKAKGSRRDR